MECPTATAAFFEPRRPLRRAYCAARYVPLERAAARAASVNAPCSHLDPLRVLPERRLPADSSLPGHIPAHEARWPEVGNRLMSTPISAIRVSAVLRSTPGIVSRSSTSPEKGAITRSISELNPAIDSSR